MPINNVPAVQDIIEQTNLLEQMFHTPIEAALAYAQAADDEIFPNGIGETLTKTRPALFPLSAAITPINPSTNTNLDNGLTNQYYTFEQYQLPINEYALTTFVNIMQDRTLIRRIFVQNIFALGENAVRTLDGLCSQYLHTAYDSGNTFATAAVTGATSIHVDNINGFSTAFSSTNSPGLPSTTTGANPVTASVYNGSTGVLRGTITITGFVADNPNTSTAFVNGIAYGVSGNLSTIAVTGFAISVGDHIVASDGSFIVFANGRSSRFYLQDGDSLTLQLIARAKARLARRNVPPFAGNLYLAIIDPELWPQLLDDTAFQRATMGQMGETGYFSNAMISRTLGMAFINSNMVPGYTLPAGGIAAGVGFARQALVIGRGSLIRGTFQGHIDAAKQAAAQDNAEIRFIDSIKAALLIRAPLDVLQEQMNETWKWVGGFVAPTDVGSTPLIIPTTDYSRYKRAVSVQCYSDT